MARMLVCGMGCVYMWVLVYKEGDNSINCNGTYLAQDTSFTGPFLPHIGKMGELYAIGSFPLPPTHRVNFVGCLSWKCVWSLCLGWAGGWGGV